jgi:type IV secretion system protein VirD4
VSADPLDELRAETARYGYGLRLGAVRPGAGSFVAPEHSLLALGPPRSGKTSTLIVPNVLSACGAVVTTSTKPDVALATAPARRRVGECLLFDPRGGAGEVATAAGLRPVGWSPVQGSLHWDGAALMAETMVRTCRPGQLLGEAAHWVERAQALLAPAFHAAALDEMPMPALLSLVDRREGRELRAILARHDSPGAAHGTGLALDALDGVLATDEREQSGIWSTAASVLSAYRSERALATASLPSIDFDALVRGGDTLYICSSADGQRQAAPIVGGLLRDARAAAYEAAAAGALGVACRRPPLLLLLDEVANIAPLHDLPSLVAEGGGQGVVTLACLQDLSQAEARWGREGSGLLSIFNTKVIFPGIADVRTLEAVSKLGGMHEVTAVSSSDGPRRTGLPGLLGRRGPDRHTYSTRLVPRLPVDRIASGEPGRVVCIDGATPSSVELRPWFEVARFRTLVEASRALELPDRALVLSKSELEGRGRRAR